MRSRDAAIIQMLMVD